MCVWYKNWAWNFQIQLLGEKIWCKYCNFEDNIGLWILKMFILTTFVFELFKSDYPEGRYWAKTAFFKITWGVGTPNIHLDHFCLGTFQIWLLGGKIWGKSCIFQDNTGCGYSKHLSQKWSPFVLEFIKRLFHSVSISPQTYQLTIF